jgi:hypothetical protein
VLGEDGLREKGTMKQKQFCPTAVDFKAMTLLMTTMKKSEPIVEAETIFEVTTVAELEPTVEKPVVKFSVVEVEPGPCDRGEAHGGRISPVVRGLAMDDRSEAPSIEDYLGRVINLL